ncbi:MAG TPA: transmembrane 220 family protein [Leptospiraceae bacterium]|nr:transmembrane 220 family protein [Leptospiraceae bacterium]
MQAKKEEVLIKVRIINFILFTLFALVQYNDPDPYIWIMIYSYTAILCLLASFRKYYKYLYIAGAVISVLWSLSLFQSIFFAIKEFGANPIFSINMVKEKNVEEARESLGLLIVFLVMIWKYYEAKKHSKEQK